jgi:alkylresorcinol/alkylpyrone synthase
MAKILCAVTEIPKYSYNTPQILEKMDHLWLSHIDPQLRKLYFKIAESSGIDSRQSVVPIETVFGDYSFEEKNEIYKRECIALGAKVLRKALKAAELEPKDLDVIITVSCTGFMIPSVDAYLINELGLRGNIVRLPVTEMGCAAGVSGLIYAHHFTQANPQARVAVVALEAPTVTFQKNDLSKENFVSTAIFADGAAAVVLGPSEKTAPEITGTDMYHFPDTTYLMGYQLQNSGLKIVLDRDVPDAISSHFEKIFFPFLDRHHLKPEDIAHYMFHPGGKKIINGVENFISKYRKDISGSKAILKKYGNMSSCTVFYILSEQLKRPAQTGDYGYLLAFGPGFSAQSLLLRWQ